MPRNRRYSGLVDPTDVPADLHPLFEAIAWTLAKDGGLDAPEEAYPEALTALRIALADREDDR